MKVAGTIVLIVLAAARADTVTAQCHVAAAKPCAIDLRGAGAPRMSDSCTTEAWKGHIAFELPDNFADADRNGWHEVVVRLDVDPTR